MRLMAVMAHPDDAEIWCGGTLILHAAKGDEVGICTLSFGLHGPFKPDRYVNVTAAWEKKIAVINAHQSQALDYYLSMIEKQCIAHGQASGKQRAEAFLYFPFFGAVDNGSPLGG